MKKHEFTKDQFQAAWGEEGYYENFSWGIGIDNVCDIALNPFLGKDKTVLEIGCGGGVFTKRIAPHAFHTIAIDVVKCPPRLQELSDNHHLTYVELPDKDYQCGGIEGESIDFAFTHGCFCHLPDAALKQYLKHVNRVLRKDGEFVFMISNYEDVKGSDENEYKRNDFLPMGHFYQDKTTLKDICNKKEWWIISEDMIPHHPHLYIHLKKK